MPHPERLNKNERLELDRIVAEMIALGGCSFDFETLRDDFYDCEVREDSESSYSHCKRFYLGNHTLLPSGTPWELEVGGKDDSWMDLLNEAAELIGAATEWSDGDLFLSDYFDLDEDEVSDDEQYGEGGSDCGDSAAY